MTAASLRPHDEKLLRRAFDVAKRARDAGDHPFGAVLAYYEGKILMEQGSGFTSEGGGDRTGPFPAATRVARRATPQPLVPRQMYALHRG